MGFLDEFKKAFQASAVGNFGSGWTWLVKKADGFRRHRQHGRRRHPLTTGDKALLCIDVWEHAYYIDYRNLRPKFVETFLNALATGPSPKRTSPEALEIDQGAFGRLFLGLARSGAGLDAGSRRLAPAGRRLAAGPRTPRSGRTERNPGPGRSRAAWMAPASSGQAQMVTMAPPNRPPPPARRRNRRTAPGMRPVSPIITAPRRSRRSGAADTSAARSSPG